jgi:hypothetical protein
MGRTYKTRIYTARFKLPKGFPTAVQPDDNNCVRNALVRAGGSKYKGTNMICVTPAELLREHELLLRGGRPIGLANALALLLGRVYATHRGVCSRRGATGGGCGGQLRVNASLSRNVLHFRNRTTVEHGLATAQGRARTEPDPRMLTGRGAPEWPACAISGMRLHDKPVFLLLSSLLSCSCAVHRCLSCVVGHSYCVQS